MKFEIYLPTTVEIDDSEIPELIKGVHERFEQEESEPVHVYDLITEHSLRHSLDFGIFHVEENEALTMDEWMEAAKDGR